jgi:RNA polymerase sigma-70 factor, ECF subfamily
VMNADAQDDCSTVWPVRSGFRHTGYSGLILAIGLRIGIVMPILQAVIGDDFLGVLAAAQHGSEAAFSVLWRDANPDLLRYLRVAAPEATEDVASEIWVQVCRGLRGFRGDEQAWRSWLFTIARRRAIDEGRRRSRHPVAPLDDLPQARELRAPDAEAQALENLATAGVITAVLALPPIQAEVILLRMLGGLDNETVARIVGRSPGAVRVAAHRGLRGLAQSLSPAGVTK